MSKILVIGYGNPLRGDDGLGWYVAQELEREAWNPHVEVLVRCQLNLELAELISQKDLVIFVDADAGDRPGKLICKPVRADTAGPDFFTHHVDLSLLLACAGQLYGNCPKAFTLSITGQSFAYDVGLSAPVLDALPELWERLTALLDGVTEEEKACA